MVCTISKTLYTVSDGTSLSEVSSHRHLISSDSPSVSSSTATFMESQPTSDPGIFLPVLASASSLAGSVVIGIRARSTSMHRESQSIDTFLLKNPLFLLNALLCSMVAHNHPRLFLSRLRIALLNRYAR